MTEGTTVEIVAELAPKGREPIDMATDLGDDLRGTASYDVWYSTVTEAAYLVRWGREEGE